MKFHDGRDFGAQDVADTLNHVSAPDSGMQIRVIIDWIKNVEVVAPDKVRIHAKAPTPAALEFLSGTTPIYPRGHYDERADRPGARRQDAARLGRREADVHRPLHPQGLTSPASRSH